MDLTLKQFYMKQNTSYKEMLRDRVPLYVDMALKWCKAKECWINHVYNNFINIYADKTMRYEATRIALGISSKFRNFEFSKTIAWDNLDEDETENWKRVQTWVQWFCKYARIIEDKYEEYKYTSDDEKIKLALANELFDTEDKELAYKLVEYIISSI